VGTGVLWLRAAILAVDGVLTGARAAGCDARDDPRARAGGPLAYDPGMSPAVLLLVLVGCLLALVPVWRLRVAGWPPGSLFTAWVVFAVAIILAGRFAGPLRFLLPILVLAYVAPFVAGPERLSRVLGGRRPPERTIIDVTPKPAPGRPDSGGDDDDDGPDAT
jgi:hypothetical protein